MQHSTHGPCGRSASEHVSARFRASIWTRRAGGAGIRHVPQEAGSGSQARAAQGLDGGRGACTSGGAADWARRPAATGRSIRPFPSLTAGACMRCGLP
eukprot:361497-Chlamydomonas_euryale.AAC.4